MSNYELRDNSGSAFRESNKKGPNSPDLKGSAKIAGVEYWVSVWEKTSKNGNKFLSYSFTPKDQGSFRQEPANSYDAPAEVSHDEDMPF